MMAYLRSDKKNSLIVIANFRSKEIEFELDEKLDNRTINKTQSLKWWVISGAAAIIIMLISIVYLNQCNASFEEDNLTLAKANRKLLADKPTNARLLRHDISKIDGYFAEEEVSEMLLPIMVGSGLFDDQPEFADIAQDANLMDDMIVQIPEALTALYLFCNAPDEKPAILKPRHH